jgi:hypothetical protein
MYLVSSLVFTVCDDMKAGFLLADSVRKSMPESDKTTNFGIELLGSACCELPCITVSHVLQIITRKCSRLTFPAPERRVCDTAIAFSAGSDDNNA